MAEGRLAYDWGMTLSLIKRYIPRSLYGRAALILLLPVITLQLVVTVVFIKRHFEDVTDQLTRAVAQEIHIIEGHGFHTQSGQELLAALSFQAEQITALPGSPVRRWYDFSGLVITRSFDAQLAGFEQVDLPDNIVANVIIRSADHLWQVTVPRDRLSAANPHQLFVNMIFFGTIVTIIAYIYLRNQLRPIKRLARAATAFGRGEVIPFSPAGASELRAAGLAFVQMRARIERFVDQRTMMLSAVSHDLRTPLTRLRLGLSMLDDAEAAALLRDVDDMQRLLDEYLTFAKGDMMSSAAQACDLSTLLHDIQNGFARQNTPITKCEWPDDLHLICRPLAIKRAIENLISNALKHGQTVWMTAQAEPDRIIIMVEDDGPGIPDAQRDEALQPFVRLDKARNQDGGGSVGLGLSIAADIARAHGGMLQLDDSPNLQGLRAKLTLHHDV